MLNIAIVGMGGIGNVHARCYQKIPNVKLVACCDIIKEKADKAAKDYGAQAFYSVQEMLQSGLAIDAASMCTRGEENGSDHFKPTMELLEAGMPTLGEKPISNKLDEARQMVALGQKKNVPYAINLNHRFTPAAKRAKEWLEAGRLGELNILNLTMWINNRAETSPHFHMRALHPHSFDICRYFAGDVAKVQAFFKKGKGRKIWSNVQVNLLFKNGVIGHLTGSYDAGGSYGLETLELVGSDGRVVIKEACQDLQFYPRRSVEMESFKNLGGMTEFSQTFGSRIAAWVADLEKKTPPDQIDGKAEDGLKVQTIIEACIESWDKGTIVEL
ncbi:MAG: Gfo/Idh/MocA family oxidoreductase [Candidatus Sumerlaeota bacterium]|nr:Gfo/Idh/MocA family oxidoreductase [Candidatus Sumerlaeota bacterium]